MRSKPPAGLRHAIAACVVGALATMLPAPEAAAELSLDYNPVRRTVSIKASDEPLSDVLRALAREAGCSIRSKVALDAPVTVNLSGVTLSQALSRLLKDHNHVVLFDGDQPEQIRIYPGKGSARTGTSTLVPGAGGGSASSGTEAEEVGDLVLTLSDPDASRVAKARALKALSERGDPDSLAALVHSLELVDSPGLKLGVIRALGRSRSDIAVTALNELLLEEHPRPEKLAAVRALGEIGSMNAIQALASVASGDDAALRQQAQQQLERLR